MKSAASFCRPQVERRQSWPSAMHPQQPAPQVHAVSCHCIPSVTPGQKSCVVGRSNHVDIQESLDDILCKVLNDVFSMSVCIKHSACFPMPSLSFRFVNCHPSAGLPCTATHPWVKKCVLHEKPIAGPESGFMLSLNALRLCLRCLLFGVICRAACLH